MFFRFGSGLFLVVLVSIGGITLEKRNLELRREVTRQRYRSEALSDVHARLRLQTQQLGAPQRVMDHVEDGSLQLKSEIAENPERSPAPLLYWQRDPTAGSRRSWTP